MPNVKTLVKFCARCSVSLEDDNWFPSFKKNNIATCKSCHSQKIVGQFYCPQCSKQLTEGICSICYDPRCIKCGTQLLADNWYAAHQKLGLLRCKSCHGKITGSWQKENPESSRKRTAQWRERNPEHQPIYYREHKEEFAQRAIERLWRLKIEAITKLGGKCVACGLTDMRLLQINHLNGRSEAEKKKFGHEMYQIIVDGSRVLDDLDVRCANHNLLYEYERGMRRMPADASFHTRETAMDVTEATEES